MSCPSCLTDNCDREIKEHRIRMVNYAYPVMCCETERQRLQKAEDLKRAGIRQERVIGLHRMSGIPEKFKDVTFRDYRIDFDNGVAAKAANEFAMDFPGKNVLLLGSRGTGKTMLGCAALNYIIDHKGMECRYIYTPDFFGLLRERINNIELTALTAGQACRLPCVFFDDIGVDKDSEWSQSIYMRILDARYREQLPTFMASNEGMVKLEQILGARSMSRIVESFTIAEIKGVDRRMQGSGE